MLAYSTTQSDEIPITRPSASVSKSTSGYSDVIAVMFSILKLLVCMSKPFINKMSVDISYQVITRHVIAKEYSRMVTL